MTHPPTNFDVTPFLEQEEGQHFECKSLFEGPPDHKTSRPRRAVRDHIAEYVAAFANAGGGLLLLGVEDNGEPTGHNLPQRAVAKLLQTPVARLKPPQSPGFTCVHQGIELLVFDVPATDGPVQVVGNGFPMRMGDQTVQVSETQIRKLKFMGNVESYESRPSPLRIEDLDPSLLAQARQGAGLSAISDAAYLLRRKMADRRGSGIALRRAAELVFAKQGPDHPNAGVRLFRVVGTERRYGASHNVEERPRIEGDLAQVVSQAMASVGSLLRRPSRLIGTRFVPAPEYPDFSWKEAVLNAIAHRDYSIAGRTTEVWLFDDRMEVVSPGGLVSGVTLSDLTTRQRIHSSRNPRLVRALVDLGYMRDQGEGIPRMYAEMEDSFLPAPELQALNDSFSVILRNTPILTSADTRFISSLKQANLDTDAFRVLLEAHRMGRVDNAQIRRLIGIDTHAASVLLRKLRDRELLQIQAAGTATYYTLHPNHFGTDLQDLSTDLQDLHSADQQDLGADQQDLGADQQDLGADQQDLLDSAPAELCTRIAALGVRPRKQKLWPIIRALVALRPMTASEIAKCLGRSNVHSLVVGHLTPMVANRQIERTHPNRPNHPLQAYKAVPPEATDGS